MARRTLASVVVLGLASNAAAQCVWGSFDDTRINYSAGVFSTGSNFDTLRALVTTGGGTIAPGTPTLTPTYLSTIDVFFTSLLTNNNVPLSPAEQAALAFWVGNGGTLIVTADIFNLPGYDSFTSFLGVTNYAAITGVGNGPVTGSHALTAGVAAMGYNTNSTFTIPGDALALANDAAGNLYSAVLDPATGHAGPGRLFVVGDHNMFTELLIAQNKALAINMVAWACEPPTVCYPDCEADGDLDLFDFLCFQGKFAIGAPYADCEADGDHDLFDFLCFQGKFASGCN